MAARISCEDLRRHAPASCAGRGDHGTASWALPIRNRRQARLKTEGDRVETNLKGKTVFVTDVLRHFGTPMALAFAKEGANLFLATMSPDEQLEHAAGAAAAFGVKVVTDVCDVSREAQVEAAVDKCIAELGGVDVVLNNVLFPVPPHAFGAVPFEVWKRKIEVELTGSFFLFKAVLPRMIAQQWGRIINCTGLAAFQGTDALAGSTEMGMVGLTRGIAREYGKYNITANCIGTGGFENEEAEGGQSFPPGPRDPLARWGTPEELAFLAVSLASDASGYVTGQCVLANGGKYFL
jgi:NAD(P)-dependent dehydrogenase (short-subunit alcohol dehydrogenase family)